MTALENAINTCTETLHAVAESFQNIDVVYKPFGYTLPYRREVRLTDPPQYLGTIELTASQIAQPDTDRRIALRYEYLRIFRETGHDQLAGGPA
jgi:hypothetical protein